MKTIKELSGPVWPDELPPFEAGGYINRHRFVWWSWNPWYPYWSQSCWGSDTEAGAWQQLQRRIAIKMRTYHNKLVRLDGNEHTVVSDLPPNESSEAWEALIATKTPQEV